MTIVTLAMTGVFCNPMVFLQPDGVLLQADVFFCNPMVFFCNPMVFSAPPGGLQKNTIQVAH